MDRTRVLSCFLVVCTTSEATMSCPSLLPVVIPCTLALVAIVTSLGSLTWEQNLPRITGLRDEEVMMVEVTNRRLICQDRRVIVQSC